MTRNKLLLVIILSLLVYSCSDREDTRTYLVSAESYLLVKKNTLKSFAQASGLNISPGAIKYDVEVFKITYRTMYRNEMIQASGLVSLPQTSEPVGMISFQHGTIVDNTEAPSSAPTSDQTVFLYAALASPGFIAVIPDFIGFGASEELLHPYYVEEATASSIIDNLRAAKELSNQKEIPFNQKLFLAGYSQGGYATMATHKAIEEKAVDGFNLIASFPAAGGYDVKGMQEYFFNLDTYDEPYYIAYVARAYQVHYDWTAPLSDFFNEPYASRIPDLFNGTKSGSEINAELTEDVSTLINANLLQNIDTDDAYSYIVDAFHENSLVDWAPAVPMYLYHGDKDITVPYQNSVDTYEQLIANGASASVVQFIPLPGADHGSGIFPYIEDFIPKLISLQ